MYKWLVLFTFGSLVISPALAFAFQQDEDEYKSHDVFDGEYDVRMDGDTYHLSLTTGSTNVDVDKPAGWTFHLTKFGVLLMEGVGLHPGISALEQMTVHVFVPPIDYFSDFTLPDSEMTNLAFSVLDYVRESPSLVGDAHVSEAVSFEWNEIEAAYYLLNSGDGSLTLLIALEAPDTNQLLVTNITAPAHEMAHLRQFMPHILDTLVINGLQLDSTLLDILPDTLTFPGIDEDDAPVIDLTTDRAAIVTP